MKNGSYLNFQILQIDDQFRMNEKSVKTRVTSSVKWFETILNGLSSHDKICISPH